VDDDSCATLWINGEIPEDSYLDRDKLSDLWQPDYIDEGVRLVWDYSFDDIDMRERWGL
jgi:hypothetical protein